MGKHLKQLEKELLEAQIKVESIQLDINLEVSRLYYKENPPLTETVGPKVPKATGIDKRFQEDMIDEMDSQY